MHHVNMLTCRSNDAHPFHVRLQHRCQMHGSDLQQPMQLRQPMKSATMSALPRVEAAAWAASAKKRHSCRRRLLIPTIHPMRRCFYRFHPLCRQPPAFGTAGVHKCPIHVILVLVVTETGLTEMRIHLDKLACLHRQVAALKFFMAVITPIRVTHDGISLDGIFGRISLHWWLYLLWRNRTTSAIRWCLYPLWWSKR